MPHTPSPTRYANPAFFRRCGRSGLKLPRLALGLWHGFGAGADPDAGRSLVLRAFDLGITHFDLANTYGPPPGAAEERFSAILHTDLAAHRDELVISTKAGFPAGEGPCLDGGSRKHLLTSLDNSLRRLRLDRVDIFYSHRPDPDTPLEETVEALAQAVQSGKALYAGISNYDPTRTERAVALLRSAGTPCLIHQVRYNLFERTPEWGLLGLLRQEGVGCIAYSPLAQGLLAGRYLGGLPADSRAIRDPRFLRPELITEDRLARVRQLEPLARARGQTIAQLALAWVLRNPVITSALIGASTPAQVAENVAAADRTQFSAEEDAAIERIFSAPNAPNATG